MNKWTERFTLKMPKHAIFVRKYLVINMLKIKNIVKLGTTAIIQLNIGVLPIATDTDTLLMVEKSIRGGICHAIHWHVKADSWKLCLLHMKDYNKNKESSYRKYWDVNKLYGWAM